MDGGLSKPHVGLGWRPARHIGPQHTAGLVAERPQCAPSVLSSAPQSSLSHQQSCTPGQCCSFSPSPSSNQQGPTLLPLHVRVRDVQVVDCPTTVRATWAVDGESGSGGARPSQGRTSQAWLGRPTAARHRRRAFRGRGAGLRERSAPCVERSMARTRTASCLSCPNRWSRSASGFAPPFRTPISGI